MSIQKIKAGRVKSVSVDDYVGDKGTLFYDEDLGDLRLSDGVTVGGIPLNSGSSSSGTTRTVLTPNMPPVGVAGAMWYNPDTSILYISQGVSWIPITSPDSDDISSVHDIPLGNGLYVSQNGELSVDFSVITVPVATETSYGVVKVGSGLNVDQAGVLSVDLTTTPESLPTATQTAMGAIKVGSGLAVDTGGTLNVNLSPTQLPIATTTSPGAITLGPGLGLTADGAVTVTVYTNNDGGTPVSNYGGITPYDGGGVI
jgi:hypothetical protein